MVGLCVGTWEWFELSSSQSGPRPLEWRVHEEVNECRHGKECSSLRKRSISLSALNCRSRVERLEFRELTESDSTRLVNSERHDFRARLGVWCSLLRCTGCGGRAGTRMCLRMSSRARTRTLCTSGYNCTTLVTTVVIAEYAVTRTEEERTRRKREQEGAKERKERTHWARGGRRSRAGSSRRRTRPPRWSGSAARPASRARSTAACTCAQSPPATTTRLLITISNYSLMIDNWSTCQIRKQWQRVCSTEE